MQIEKVNLIQRNIQNATVNVERYFLLYPQNLQATAYCFYSYFFQIDPANQYFHIKMIYFEKPLNTEQWIMKDVLLRKNKDNHDPESNEYRWTIFPENQNELNVRLQNELIHHLEQLYNYLIGESKEDYFKILKRDYYTNKPLLTKTLIDSGGDILMFGASAYFANLDSDTENKIKNNATRKNEGNDNTLNMTKDILKNISLPKGGLTVQNIELNNAFRISYT